MRANAFWAEMSACEHFVQIYESEEVFIFVAPSTRREFFPAVLGLPENWICGEWMRSDCAYLALLLEKADEFSLTIHTMVELLATTATGMRYSLFSAGSNTVMQSPRVPNITRWNHQNQPNFPICEKWGTRLFINCLHIARRPARRSAPDYSPRRTASKDATLGGITSQLNPNLWWTSFGNPTRVWRR